MNKKYFVDTFLRFRESIQASFKHSMFVIENKDMCFQTLNLSFGIISRFWKSIQSAVLKHRSWFQESVAGVQEMSNLLLD